MKTILQVIMASILLSLTSYVIANKTTFKDLQYLKNDWYKLLFYSLNTSPDLRLYKTRDDYIEGYDRRKDFYLVKIPPKLKQIIFSNHTINPFKSMFPYIYTVNNKKIITRCANFTGVQFELDDNPETTEWYIIAPVETCLRDKDFFRKNPVTLNPSEVGHIWIVQKQPNGQYRIVMEAEGDTAITNTKHQGYKQLDTFIYNRHIYRREVENNSNKYCGKAGISWRYQSGNYQPTRVGGSASNCKYHSERHKNMLVKNIVIPLVLQWLNIYTPEQITINEKNEVVPLQINQHPKQKKTVSNCIKNNAMHKAAARGDYRFIAQCLRNL